MKTLTVKRSPAKVSWHVMYGDTCIAVRNTRAKAEAEMERLKQATGLHLL